ncbi:MAG TPA: DUF308 domain-containing protein [Terriglobales bacterium]|jgi:uncharacterized membrane protein HdeD (DUF308 family)
MTTLTLQPTQSLRNLYFTRTIVQLVWAVAVIGVAVKNPFLGATLLILYPLWDVACTLYDLKTAAGSDSAKTQYVNAAAGIATAAGLGLTAYAHPQYAVAIFGGWALVAGLLQLAVGVLRRQRLGGQWAMILSGAQSLVAGVAFVLGGLSEKTHLKDLGGYAIFGAVYFLAGGVLLNRRRSRVQP